MTAVESGDKMSLTYAHTQHIYEYNRPVTRFEERQQQYKNTAIFSSNKINPYMYSLYERLRLASSRSVVGIYFSFFCVDEQ